MISLQHQCYLYVLFTTGRQLLAKEDRLVGAQIAFFSPHSILYRKHRNKQRRMNNEKAANSTKIRFQLNFE